MFWSFDKTAEIDAKRGKGGWCAVSCIVNFQWTMSLKPGLLFSSFIILDSVKPIHCISNCYNISFVNMELFTGFCFYDDRLVALPGEWHCTCCVLSKPKYICTINPHAFHICYLCTLYACQLQKEMLCEKVQLTVFVLKTADRPWQPRGTDRHTFPRDPNILGKAFCLNQSFVPLCLRVCASSYYPFYP